MQWDLQGQLSLPHKIFQGGRDFTAASRRSSLIQHCSVSGEPLALRAGMP